MKSLCNEKPGILINLGKIFPISFLYVLQSSLPWFLLLCLLGAVAFAVNAVADSASAFLTYSNNALMGAAAFLALGIVMKLLYGVLYRRTYFYGIDGRHFVISKGVLLKQRRSCPFNHITDFYIGRSFLDFIFGLYYLEVRTPALDHGEAGKIDGLSFSAAAALQNYLTDLLDEAEPRGPRRAVINRRESVKFAEQTSRRRPSAARVVSPDQEAHLGL